MASYQGLSQKSFPSNTGWPDISTPSSYTALYRKSDLCIPEMKLWGLVPNSYIHVSMSQVYFRWSTKLMKTNTHRCSTSCCPQRQTQHRYTGTSTAQSSCRHTRTSTAHDIKDKHVQIKHKSSCRWTRISALQAFVDRHPRCSTKSLVDTHVRCSMHALVDRQTSCSTSCSRPCTSWHSTSSCWTDKSRWSTSCCRPDTSGDSTDCCTVSETRKVQHRLL